MPEIIKNFTEGKIKNVELANDFARLTIKDAVHPDRVQKVFLYSGMEVDDAMRASGLQARLFEETHIIGGAARDDSMFYQGLFIDSPHGEKFYGVETTIGDARRIREKNEQYFSPWTESG